MHLKFIAAEKGRANLNITETVVALSKVIGHFLEFRTTDSEDGFVGRQNVLTVQAATCYACKLNLLASTRIFVG